MPGVLLSIGDGHAAQGDGEVAGTAIECGMTTELQLELVTQREAEGGMVRWTIGERTVQFLVERNRLDSFAAADLAALAEALARSLLNKAKFAWSRS